MTDHVTSALRQEGPQQERLFVSKPRTITAEQFFHDKPLPFHGRGPYVAFKDGRFYVTTAHGQTVDLVDGDWVIPEPSGPHVLAFAAYPVKPDIFAATYDEPAVSASRTAQAPQQEGVDLVTRLIDYRAQVLMGFRHISRLDEAELIQAAIDGLRHLGEGRANRGSVPPETPMIPARPLENINDLRGAQEEMIQVDWWSWKCARCGFTVKSQRTVNNQQCVAQAIARCHIEDHDKEPLPSAPDHPVAPAEGEQ